MKICVLKSLGASKLKRLGRAGQFALGAFFAFYMSVADSQAAGTVIAWGANFDLQGDVPANLAGAAAVAGGSLHSLALKPDGTVVGWGNNSFGAANVPAGLANVVAISAGYYRSLALKSDGSIMAWGSQSNAPIGLTDVVGISAGWGDSSLALKSDGTIVSWGSQSNTPAGLTNLAAVAAGGAHGLALNADGTVVAWGDNSFGQTNVPAGLTNVVAIAAGQDHCLALKSNRTVVAWGSNTNGQTSVPTGLTNVVAIAAGALHSLALKSDGTLAAWGYNAYGQSTVRSDVSNFVAVAGGGYHSLALRNDGSPVILVQPPSQKAVLTQNAAFQVMAAGAQPLYYQWRKNGSNIGGSTKTFLVLTNVQAGDAAFYSVIVSNGFGTVTSVNALLTPIATPPVIVVPPKDLSAFCGEAVTLQVTADGIKPFGYQWQYADVPIPGATNQTLIFNPVTTNQAGPYSVVVTNIYGAVTSSVGTLTVVVDPPSITSSLTATATQGQAFTYTITGRHAPTSFSATYLPAGLTLNPTNGVISGTNLENGIFGVVLGAVNACASSTALLALSVSSSVPVITSPLTASGTEGASFSYQITATKSPTGYGAVGLPPGLTVDPLTGLISGTAVYAGEFDSTIWASNIWGAGSASLHFSLSNAVIAGLSIANVTYDYSSPYLLDFQFSLRDDNDPTNGLAVVVPASLLSVVCKEDDVAISPSETAFVVQLLGGSTKLVKSELVLDFTESIASLSNGDTNADGISDAVDSLVGGAKDFVNQQPLEAQIGLYEFHREDVDPQKVVALTTNKTVLTQAIDGIWTNYVQGYPAGSRCWDALTAAITDIGASNRDEQHYVVFVSDGRDESSTSTITNVINLALTNGVKVYCIGFGAELNTNSLQLITSRTQGRYYTATNASDLAAQFARISKDLNGQYFLRWATLKRSNKAFTPSFEITYQGLTALSPSNTTYLDTNNPIIDTNQVPPTTNYNTLTNVIIATYVPTQHTGDVTVGSLRLVTDAAVGPGIVTLRASYVPRYIRRLRIHYRANWPCTTSLLSTAPGELLEGWSLTETNDGTGGQWMEIVSPYPQSVSNSLPYGALGNLVKFSLRDITSANTAFSVLEMDNTIYMPGPQTFIFENATAFLRVFPALPYGTPVPWLIGYGYSGDFVAAEVSDSDGDGLLTWQEYQANTSPRNPNSKLFIRRLAQNSTHGWYEITFPSALNRTYRVDASSDLVNWQTLQDNIAGTGADLVVTDNRFLPGATQMYYRLLVR